MARIGFDAMKHPELSSVLQEINQLIAKAFLNEPKQIKVTLVDSILPIPGENRRYEILGTCKLETGEIDIVLRPGWGNTFIHELAHIYKPEVTEIKIKKIKNDLVKYLKFMAQ